MKKESIFNMMLFILILFGFLSVLIYILRTPLTEPFYYSGEYPNTVDNPILYDTYNVNNSPGLSGLTSTQIYKNYPNLPINSCANNNVRYWRKPTNGLCSPSDLCGDFYESTEREIPPPPSPPKNSGVRVNYYSPNVKENCQMQQGEEDIYRD